MNNISKKRNGTIDFLKFIFAISVVMYHGRTLTDCSEIRILRGGYLAVEFFFIVSGYFMVASYYKDNSDLCIGKKAQNFIKHKISLLLPNIYIAWIISFITIHLATNECNIKNIIEHICESFSDLLLLKMSGLVWRQYNDVTWYLSAMLISMFFIYSLMLKFKDDFFYIILPLLFIFLCGYLFSTYGNLSELLEWNGLFLNGTLRAICGILGGCLCYQVSTHIKLYRYTKLARICITFIEAPVYLFAIYLMQYNCPSKYDFLAAFLLMIGVVISTSNISYSKIIFSNKICYWLGEFSFSLYLGHFWWRDTLTIFFPNILNYYNRLAIYFVLSLITALIIMYISKILKIVWNKNSKKIKQLLIIE